MGNSTCSSVHKNRMHDTERDHLRHKQFTLEWVTCCLSFSYQHRPFLHICPYKSVRKKPPNPISFSLVCYKCLCVVLRVFFWPQLQVKTSSSEAQPRLTEQNVKGSQYTQHRKKEEIPLSSAVRVICICFVWDKSDGNPASYLTSLIFTHTCWDKVNTPSESNTLMDDPCIKT